MGKLQEHTFSVEYHVPPHVIFGALTDQLEMCRFTQGPAVSELSPNGKFMLYDGMISGVYQEIDSGKSYTMQWRMKDWADGVHSSCKVSLLDAGNSNTEVKVEQTEIPEYDRYDKFVHLDNLENGWKQMIF